MKLSRIIGISLFALLASCNNDAPLGVVSCDNMCINELNHKRDESNEYFFKAVRNNTMYQTTMRELCVANRHKAEELMTQFHLKHGCEIYDGLYKHGR